MKALKFVFIKLLLFSAIAAQAQVTVNIGTPPPWGPTGYTEVRYYYLPDVESYYDVHATQFIIFSEGAWVHRSKLPSKYKSYDLYSGYKVVMTDYHGSAPYFHFDDHKVKYGKGYRGPEQKTIGQKPGKGNTGSKNNSNGNSGNDNGKDKSNGKGNSKKK